MILERFLKYVSYDTQSDENSTTTPSTDKQMTFAKVLEQECRELFDSVILDSTGILYCQLDGDSQKDTIGLCAHMDTATECSGANVHPRVIKEYDGSTIQLNDKISMHPDAYPKLAACIGDDLVVTDGSTLLGGDDKAGIAIILEAIEQLKASNLSHAPICVAFTVDEEIGRGADQFDLTKFPCAYAYTVDGDRIDNVEWENFNAAQAIVHIQGTAIHPGEGKGKLVNASLLAMDFAKCLPNDQTPATTCDRQGFYHLVSMQGAVEHAQLVYLLRDHDKTKFPRKKLVLQQICDALNDKYGPRFSVEIKDQYYNMADFMQDKKPVEKAKAALLSLGIEPVSIPVRGGTDGARLTEMGLACPNLGTGTFHHHGVYEFASITKMEKMVEVVKTIVTQ